MSAMPGWAVAIAALGFIGTGAYFVLLTLQAVT